MPITTCPSCGRAYEERSEEEANAPTRTCMQCYRKGNDDMITPDHNLVATLEQFARVAHENSVNKGFWPAGTDEISPETCGSKIALMHSELSEMLEGVRKPGPDAHCPGFTSEEIELADLFIRGADYARARRLRLGAAILAKMAFNTGRPHKHGKAI